MMVRPIAGCIVWPSCLPHRRQGIGAQLVAGVEAAAWSAGAQSVTLGVRIPLSDNHRFYIDLGYRIAEARRHDGYEFPTWYLMQKRPGSKPTPPFDVVVVPYDPHWSDQFAAEAARIAPALGHNLLEIRHVGSTSVPGLAAKPIIDMMPMVRDIRLVDVATAQMIDLGYEPMGEFGLSGTALFPPQRRWCAHSPRPYLCPGRSRCGSSCRLRGLSLCSPR